VSLAVTPLPPVAINTPLTFTATTNGGMNVRYQFWLYNPKVSPSWTQLRAYSASASLVWTPTTAGSYLISVTAQDGTTGPQANTTAWYQVTSTLPLTKLSTTMSPVAPSPANTPITITAIAVGGTGVQYQFWVYNSNALPTWSQLNAFSSNASCVWTPATTGNYLLSVTAIDALTGSELNSSAWYAVGAQLTAVTASAVPTAPQPNNTPITITATATGGSNIQYQFWIYNSSATPAWTQLQAYSPTATCVWTPSTFGNYLIAVTALDSLTGASVNTIFWYSVVPLLTAVSCTTAPTAPQPANTSITLSASATGGTTVQYQFWVYNSSATPAWSQLQAYSVNATCVWQPTTAGSYLISVTALDGATGTTVNKMFWYTIR